MNISFGDAGTWVAAIATLMVFTYLIDFDNPIWLLVQHMYMGLAYGYSVAISWHDFIKPALIGKHDSIAAGQWWYIIPVIVGLLVYARYFPSIGWIARYPISMWIGYGSGLILAEVSRTFMGQIRASFYKLWGSGSVGTYIDNWILLITLLACIAYFFFTVKRDGPVMSVGVGIGRWTIMVALGASFGSTVLYRYQLFFGRVQFLVVNWLHLAS